MHAIRRFSFLKNKTSQKKDNVGSPTFFPLLLPIRVDVNDPSEKEPSEKNLIVTDIVKNMKNIKI